MERCTADGPKTEPVLLSGRMQQAVEDQIAALTRGLSDCLDMARTAKAENPFDDTRSSERRDAMQLASATAELLQAVAKLKGEFRHDYRITRNEDRPAGKPALKVGWSGREADLLTQAEYDTLNEWEQVDYMRWTDGLPPRFGGWDEKRARRAKEEARPAAEAPDEGEDDGAGDRTPLPPENRGSNCDAAKS